MTTATAKLDALIGKLEGLEGAHDQTMRCQIIDALYPATKEVTATERFRITELARLRELRRMLIVDLLDEE